MCVAKNGLIDGRYEKMGELIADMRKRLIDALLIWRLINADGDMSRDAQRKV